MNIFNIIPRNIQRRTTSRGVDFVVNLINTEGHSTVVSLCTIYRQISSGSTDSVLRVLNGSSMSCAPSNTMDGFGLIWDGNGDFIYKNLSNGNIAFKIEKEEISKIGLEQSERIEFTIELGNILRNISLEGRMPMRYRSTSAEISEHPPVIEEASLKKKLVRTIDDIPDDVFTMETVIERIKNCGSIANAKEVPVIIRFDDKKLMITDTSVEDGFLYLDVIEVPKKKLEKPSIKFSDYIKYTDQGFTIGDGIFEQINMNYYTYDNVTSAISDSFGSSGSSN